MNDKLFIKINFTRDELTYLIKSLEMAECMHFESGKLDKSENMKVYIDKFKKALDND